MLNPVRLMNIGLSGLGAIMLMLLMVAATEPQPYTVRTPIRATGWADAPQRMRLAKPVPNAPKSNTRAAKRLQKHLDAITRPVGRIARADTDSVRLVVRPPRPDSLIAPKPTAIDSFLHVSRYLSKPKARLGLTSGFTLKRRQPFGAPLSANWRLEAKLDSTGKVYTFREMVGKEQVRPTTRADLGLYLKQRQQNLLTENFRTLASLRTEQRQARRNNGFSFNYQIPGGQNTAFSTIFGKPEVDLRVTGQADIDAGFERQVTDDPSRTNQKRIDPLFKQNLRLGVRGTIGDKLNIDVNWDTKRQFEFENQMRLVYTGYEDEIVKRIEAGNVTLDSRSSLINGGRSLFGIRTDLKLGGIDVTVVASQQKSTGSSLELNGGSESESIGLRAYDYEDDTHFFMGYYFRSNFETSFSKPPSVVTNVREINRLEVWKQNILINPDQTNLRQVVALTDLGEPETVLTAPRGTHNVLPDNEVDQYTDGDIAFLQNGKNAVKDLILNGNVYQEGPFKILREGVDYTYDKYRGYITLTTKLSQDEALAIAVEYTDATGQIHTVGDLTGSGGNSSGGGIADTRLVLKLLRRQKPQPSDLTWPLTLRNIYRVGANNLSEENFEVNLQYDKAGQRADVKLPNVNVPNEPTLLEMLGLDRISKSNYSKSDNLVDFGTGTLDARNGRLVFPYLEPFGKRIRDIITGKAYSGTTATGVIAKDFAFDTLYTAQKSVARTLAQYDIYKISGSAAGGVQQSYNLGFALVPGSVRVEANGNLLSAADYAVNYDFGSIEILNPAYLTPGTKISIKYERANFTSIQQKNLLGVRASYNFRDNLTLGATLMRLREKPNTDKYRIGQEPVANRIWGFDGNYTIRPRWLTRAVDALPLIQTRAESSLDLRGEFARFTPESAATYAFQRTRSALLDANRDFAPDEQNGQISYIDDFEGIKNRVTLALAGLWRNSSAPDSLDAFRKGGSTKSDSLLTTWRGRMGWFNVGSDLYRGIGGTLIPSDYKNVPAMSEVYIYDIYPTIDTRNMTEAEKRATTFNLFFDPTDRGPYNYSTDFDRFIDPQQRKKLWGGITQKLGEGYNDFTTQNIEFIEFIFAPIGETNNPDAKLVVNLGSISEDVLPNARLNTEDGLSTTEVNGGNELLDGWGRIGGGSLNNILALEEDEANRPTEDLGLDGLSSYDDPALGPLRSKYSSVYKDAAGKVYTEQAYFKKFLDAINPASSSSVYKNDPIYQRLWADAQRDPSGDDFHDFREQSFFESRDADKLGRFNYHFTGSELSSPQAQSKIADNSVGGTNKVPDTEDLNGNNQPNFENNYYQYEIPLDLAVLERLSQPSETADYVISKTAEGKNGIPGWYKVSIPVRNFTSKIGKIDGFSLIQAIRLFITGVSQKTQIRFASFDLVGSQWRVSQNVGNSSVREQTPLIISSLNTEEDASRYAKPVTAIVSQIRNFSVGSVGTRDAKEQAMTMNIKNLLGGDQRAVYKTFNEGLDLLRYRNLRMFAHLDGRDAQNRPLTKEDNNAEGAKLFVRLGSDENKNYYEYEIQLKPYELKTGETPDSDKLWQTWQDLGEENIDLNSMWIYIPDLIALKSFRDGLVASGGLREGQAIWSDTLTTSGTRWDQNRNYLKNVQARISVKGNPSLNRITSVVIGVRNNRAPIQESGSLGATAQSTKFQELNVWVNELRATGYDINAGMAALGSANIRLADFATLSANVNYRDEFFGTLDSQLGNRSSQATQDWGFTTNVNLHKLLPERFGWNMPVTYSIKSSINTPRFLPDEGDLPLKDKLAAIEAEIEEDANLSAAEKSEKIETQKSALLERAQTVNFNQSVAIPVNKQNSKSPVLRYVLDPLSVSYRWSEGNSRSPQTRLDQNWQWGGSASYALNLQRLKTIRPFKFLPTDVPVVGGLSRLRFAYLPQNMKASASIDRNYRGTRQRARLGDTSGKPDELAYPFRQTHDFGLRRTFDMTYNPFEFLSLSYRNETSQSILNGIDSLFQVKDKTNLNAGILETYRSELRAREAVAGNSNLYYYSQLGIRPTGLIFNEFLSGAQTPRADRHGQDFTASFDPKLDRIKWLNWVNIQPITLGSQFDWDNGNKTLTDNVGAGVNNQLNLKGGMSLRLKSLYEKIPVYKTTKEAQARATRDRQARQRQAQQAREAERRRQEAERRNRQNQPKDPNKPSDAPKPNGDAPPKPDARPAPDAPKPIVETAKPDTSKAKKASFPIKLPLPDPKVMAQSLFMRLFSVSDLTFNYSRTQSGQSSNVTNGYYLFGKNVVPWAYRFGLRDTIGVADRIVNQNLQVSDQLRNSQQYDIRGSLELSQNLRVDFSSATTLEETNRVSYNYDAGTLIADPARNGRVSSSAWAFGASFEGMVRDQYRQFMLLKAQNPGKTTLTVQDGEQGVLTNTSVVTSFRKSFVALVGGTSVDKRGFAPLPLPGWNINYGGLQKLPFLNKLVQSASIRHGYSTSYDLDFRDNAREDSDSKVTLNDVQDGTNTTYTIIYKLPGEEAGTIRLNERFSPLIELDMRLKNGIQTNVSWKKSNSYSFGSTNFDLAINKTNEFEFRSSFSKNGLVLPFKLPTMKTNKLDNTIRFSLALALRQNQELTYPLKKGLEQALQLDDNGDPSWGNIKYVPTLDRSQTTFDAEPRLSYQFSSRVGADMYLTYTNRFGRSRNEPNLSTLRGGLNFRVSIAN